MTKKTKEQAIGETQNKFASLKVLFAAGDVHLKMLSDMEWSAVAGIEKYGPQSRLLQGIDVELRTVIRDRFPATKRKVALQVLRSRG